jgi:hypothetical protein
VTTLAFPALAGRAARDTWSRVRGRVQSTTHSLRDHVYTIVGFGCISAASFVHSIFTGLIVTGILFLVFEWKIGE